MSIAIDQQIRSRIDSFVTVLHDLVRRAAVASVAQAFGAPSSNATSVSRARGPGRPRSSNAAPSARTPSRAEMKGQRRDPGALAALTEKLREYIAKTPGKRIEDIAKALGTTTKELQLPARKLIAAKTVSTKGRKRATTYHPRWGHADGPARDG